MKETFTETLHLTFDGKMLTCTMIGDVEINVHHVRADYEASQEITDGKKFLCLVLTAPHSSITFKAQKESMKKEKHKNMLAQAIVTHSIAQRILGNFMIKFIKYSCPCRLFSSKEQAILWLNQEWNKSNKK